MLTKLTCSIDINTITGVLEVCQNASQAAERCENAVDKGVAQAIDQLVNNISDIYSRKV